MTFGASVSIDAALRMFPQEVKSCMAISDDQERLKCFDELFARPANRACAGRQAVLKNWSIEESNLQRMAVRRSCAANRAAIRYRSCAAKTKPPNCVFDGIQFGWAIGLLTYECASMSKVTSKQTWRMPSVGGALIARECRIRIRQSAPTMANTQSHRIATMRPDGK